MNKIILYILLFTSISVIGNEVKFYSSTDKQEYYEFEYVYYRLTIENGNIDAIQQPDFEGFKYINHQVSTSNNFSMSIINGKKVNNSVKKYEIVFILQPLKRGSIVLPDFKMEVEGKTYTAKGKQVFIKRFNIPESELVKEHFVWVESSNNNPYVGQSFTLKYTIFTKHPLNSGDQFITRNAFINFGDFSAKELSRFTSTEIQIKGVRYYMVEFQTHLLTPISSGSKSIPSFEIEYATYQVIQSGFFGKRKRIDKKVIAPGYKLNVKSLPAKPNNFSGLVGDFKLNLKVDKEQIKANDALTIKASLSGNGNFDALNKIEVNIPSNWEMYDPKTIDNIETTANGRRGKRVFEYVAIPRIKGDFEVSVPQLVFFNVNTHKYETISKQTINVAVEEGELGEGSKISNFNNGNREVNIVSDDIRYIKTDFDLENDGNIYLTNSTIFKSIFTLSSAGVLVFLFVPFMNNKKRDKIISREAKIKSINKELDKCKNGDKSLKRTQELIEGFWLAAFDIEKADQDWQTVEGNMKSIGITDSLIVKTKKILNDLSMSEYAKGAVNNSEVISNTQDIITEIHNHILNSEKR